MNKTKIQALIVAGLISANTLSPTIEALADTRKETNVETEVGLTREAEKSQVYLSDIDYEASSKAGWGQIRKNLNVDGNGQIRLNVDGEAKDFEKGMSAHATSTLIYNVSQYKDTYTRLVTYAGIDARRGGNGNGVVFTISTSQDGNTWTDVETTEVLKGSNEAAYIDIELNGANYVKLYAHDNGSNGSDHASYGDLKLVKPDYSLAGTPIQNLQTVEQYDNILKQNTVEHNIANNESMILRRTFVKRLGYYSIQRIAAQDIKYSEGINYLMTNMTALKYFIMGGPVNIDGSYQKALKSFCEIYAKYKNIMDDASSDYFNLRLAISIALSYGRTETVSSWIKSDKGVNPVYRYEVYQYLVSSGKMDQGGEGTDHKKWSTAEFKALPIPMMRWAVDVRLSDDEILWMVDYALSEKDKGKNHFDAYNYIEYTMGHNFDNPIYYDQSKREEYNKKYNFEKYFNDYGTNGVQRMWMVFEEGAVCGGLTQTYSILSDIFGRPSSPCGQPGHAAAVTYQWNRTNNRYEWTIQNDVSGWTETGNQFDDRMLGWGNQWRNSWSTWTNASYTVLAGDASLDYVNLEKATLLNLLADSYTDNDMKKACYEKALEHQAINLDAVEGLINCYKSDNTATSADFLELAKRIVTTYNYYPQTMMELLGYIEENITDPSDIVQVDILKNNALLRAKQATPQESTCVQMTKQMADKYLNGGEVSELATFSFDGENAGKIVLNSKYEGSSIRIEYSLDGGTKWTETDQHIIELTPDEIASITAENDIKLSLVGVSDVHVIDILDGKTITDSVVYANDQENLLLGDIENLEFSLDGGNKWCDYVTTEDTINQNGMTGIRIEGAQTVKVRYKAHGQYLQSNEHTYTFTQDNNTDDKTYIPLKNVKLEDFTSQQSTSRDHAATNFIDGNPNTAWHTAYRQEDNKFYTVSFDKERNISALEYVPGNGRNGRLRSGKVETSLDGVTWTVSGTFTNLADNTTLKEILLDNPTPAKYVKLVATETWGNSTGERDKYFSGKDIMFYEAEANNDNLATTLPDDVVVEDNTGTPDSDLDNDMAVNPDTDQVVENTPVILPDDIPVEEIKPDIPPVEDSTQDGEGWIKTATLVEMEQLWNYRMDAENQTIVLESFKGDIQRDTDVKVEIPRKIDGYKVALADLKSDMFQGVTHIKVAEAKDGEGQVKVLDANVMNGFAGNDALKYVNLEGLDVSGVDNMYGLFSFCKNLRVIEINDWVIKDTTDIMSMFYADDDYTFDERKLLVITNNERISGYNFEQSNRVPAIVTFNSNGGYFIGDTDILNMKVPRFVIRPETLEELDKVIESDVRFAGIPVREGYEFKGWYTDEPNPTNFYELLNMTYKAKWEEVVVEETPEVDTPNLPNIEYENGTGGPNTPCTLKVNTEEGLDSIMNWLNDTSVNMSYYRLKDIINNTDGTLVYQVHVFGADKLVSYINIKIDGSNAELMNELNAINVLIGIEDINSNGQGTEEKPYEVKVNTIGGMSELLDWLIVNCGNYHKSETIIEEDGKLIYEVYAVLADTESSTYANNNKEIHIKVVIDKSNNEVIEYMNDAILTAPDNDFDSGMNVDPDNDQVVDDTPVTLPDDVPVDTTDTPTTLPDDVPVEEIIQDIEVENKVDKTHVLKVNTKQGLDKVLEWLDSNMSYDREKDVVIDVDANITTYKITVFHHDMTVSYIDIKVSSDNNELIDMLDKIPTVLPPFEGEMPEDDNLDNDMMVNPDTDQVVDDTPVTLPDDVPVDTTDTPTTLPDDFEVDTNKPVENPDDDMMVNPDTDQVVDDTPVTLPDDVPVDTTDTPTTLPDDFEVDTNKPVENPDDDMMVNPDTDQVVDDTPVTLPDDVPVEDVETPSEPSVPEQPEFEHEVVEIVDGNGEADNPIELTIKDVSIDVFNSFLNELKTLNTKVVSVTAQDDFTLYVIKFNRVTKNSEDSMYAVIKVENSRGKMINALNEFAKENNTSIKDEVVLDGTHMDDIMVNPENNDTTSDDKKPNTNNSTTVNNTNKKPSKLPQTGDAVGIGTYLLLGISSILGGLGLRKKNKK